MGLAWGGGVKGGGIACASRHGICQLVGHSAITESGLTFYEGSRGKWLFTACFLRKPLLKCLRLLFVLLHNLVIFCQTLLLSLRIGFSYVNVKMNLVNLKYSGFCWCLYSWCCMLMMSCIRLTLTPKCTSSHKQCCSRSLHLYFLIYIVLAFRESIDIVKNLCEFLVKISVLEVPRTQKGV